MGKKSVARAAAVAQFLAEAAESVALARLPGKGPSSGARNERVVAFDANWGTQHYDPTTNTHSVVDPTVKTSFKLEVYYSDDDKYEDARVFEVTVREVKS